MPRNLYKMPSNEEEPYQEEENLYCNANVLQEENEDDDNIGIGVVLRI